MRIISHVRDTILRRDICKLVTTFVATLLNISNRFNDVIMGEMVPQITSLPIVYSTVYSSADQRKHHSSASPDFVWGIDRSPVNSPYKWPVTRKMFPFDDVMMWCLVSTLRSCDVYSAHTSAGWVIMASSLSPVWHQAITETSYG